MMLHGEMNDDALSLSMFLAGALMVFTPMIGASIVLAIWWRKKRRPSAAPDEQSATTQRGSDASHSSGVAIRPT